MDRLNLPSYTIEPINIIPARTKPIIISALISTSAPGTPLLFLYQTPDFSIC
jgi:hypothetical protein